MGIPLLVGVDKLQKVSHGLSTAEIGRLVYGEAVKDSTTFDSAVGPMLNQVLYMLLERGKIGSTVAGADNRRHWFVTVKRV